MRINTLSPKIRGGVYIVFVENEIDNTNTVYRLNYASCDDYCYKEIQKWKERTDKLKGFTIVGLYILVVIISSRTRSSRNLPQTNRYIS